MGKYQIQDDPRLRHGPSIRMDEETRKWLKIMAANRQTTMRALLKRLVMEEREREAAKG